MDELLAVTVDLDDTLFPQASWLDGAWTAVATRAGSYGIRSEALREALIACAAEGSDRGGIIDRALDAIGVDPSPEILPALVGAFSSWAPRTLEFYPGAYESLVRMRNAGLRLAVVTDGNPFIQRSKVAALGLTRLVDHVVISDELGGRAFRKPSPAPFLRALELCGTSPATSVHIGDRPAKDVRGAAGVDMRCIRVRTGEYAETADGTGDLEPWASVDTFADAAGMLLSVLVG